jgi:hypothetical protein
VDPQKPPFKKFLWLGLLLLVITGGLFFIIQNNDNSSEEKEKGITKDTTKSSGHLDPTVGLGLPKCPVDLSGLLAHQFMNPGDLDAIIPLGSLGPPSHTFPVDHIYFTSKNKLNARVPLYFPADSTVFEVMEETRTNYATGAYLEYSAMVSFAPCEGVDIMVGIISELPPELKSLIANDTGDCKETLKEKENGGKLASACRHAVNKKVKSGDLMGYELNVSESERNNSGGTIHPDEVKDIEIWAHNYNITPRTDIDLAWYDFATLPYSICMFDMYQGALQQSYLDKFGTFTVDDPPVFVPRTIEPICGSIVQTIAGTAQGDWFYGEKGQVDNAGNLSLVHDNYNPAIGAISIGGTLQYPTVIHFAPKYNGTINRDFSEVIADGNIYCYHTEGQVDPKDPKKIIKATDKILLQLNDDHHLTIELQPGTCGTGEAFKKSYMYQR